MYLKKSRGPWNKSSVHTGFMPRKPLDIFRYCATSPRRGHLILLVFLQVSHIFPASILAAAAFLCYILQILLDICPLYAAQVARSRQGVVSSEQKRKERGNTWDDM